MVAEKLHLRQNPSSESARLYLIVFGIVGLNGIY